MFSLLFLLTGGIYLQLMNNKKEKIKDNKEEKTTQFIPIRKVKNETRASGKTAHDYAVGLKLKEISALLK